MNVSELSWTTYNLYQIYKYSLHINLVNSLCMLDLCTFLQYE